MMENEIFWFLILGGFLIIQILLLITLIKVKGTGGNE